jgi:two-component system, NtrC family, response regulator AtoC
MDLEQWERSLIEQALRETDCNQTRAAQRLGISRDTLRYRLKKYGLQA